MVSRRTCSTTANSVMSDISPLTQPVGIVCHDAGGANQIMAMCEVAGFPRVRAYMEGPARALWHGRFPAHSLAASLDELLDETHTLITGTGWASALEHDARVAASWRGIHSIAVLDHWVNYRERFIRNDVFLLPDEIWVVDEHALRIARAVFPGQCILLKPDSYAQEQVRAISPVGAILGNELAYLLEPARSDWGRGEPGEFQALRYFLARLPGLGLPTDTIIRLRPHPSDPPGKYDAFLQPSGPWPVLLDNGDLTSAISRARWVAGCQTHAMTLALQAGRTVLCTLPPWAPACVLPHTGLIHLKDCADP